MKKATLVGIISLTSLIHAEEKITNDQLLQRHYTTQDAHNITTAYDTLFWNSHEDGLDYVIKNSSGIGFVNNGGEVKRVNSDLDWGFRLLFGYQIPHKKMHLDLTWTRYFTSGSDTTRGDFPSTLFSIWTIPGASLSSESYAKAHWDLKLNSVDLLMKALYSPLHFLDLKPYLGLVTTWIDQKFDINLNGGSSSQIFNALVLDDDIDMRNDFWGIGPKIGVGTEWIAGKGFSFIGDVDLALLFGCFDLKQSEKVTLLGLTPQQIFLDIDKNNFYLTRAALDLTFGLRWTRMIKNSRYRLFLQAGWEHLIYFGQNQLMRFTTIQHPGVNLSTQGDLTIQGLTLKGSLTF